MAEVVGIKFREVGKIYYFDPNGIVFVKGDRAIVETARGVECGDIAMENTDINDEEIVQPLKSIIRKATESDLHIVEENAEKEKKAFDIALKKIEQHRLNMKLVKVEYTFDNSKILFFYTAPSRVDFRELVKDLAGVFRARIELRQIGVRDECKKLGGISVCGRPFCCSEFLSDFQPVSIKMAKEQGLSLNPAKISGACGRLMCCLKYEQDAYEHLLKITPKTGALVDTPEGRGEVIDANLITGQLKIRLNKHPDAAPVILSRDEVKILRDAQIRVGKKELEALKDME